MKSIPAPSVLAAILVAVLLAGSAFAETRLEVSKTSLACLAVGDIQTLLNDLVSAELTYESRDRTPATLVDYVMARRVAAARRIQDGKCIDLTEGMMVDDTGRRARLTSDRPDSSAAIIELVCVRPKAGPVCYWAMRSDLKP